MPQRQRWPDISRSVSASEGEQWRRLYTLEQGKGLEFSYPYMIYGRDSMVHLVYTYNRQHIKHAVFNEAWLAEREETHEHE